MDKKKSLINVTVAILFKILILILGILTRRIVIQYIGNGANGVTSLFTSIVGVLSLAELGIGSAIAYSMYKPIVEHNNKKVAALYCAFKKLYLVISGVVLMLGLCVFPFLPILTKGYTLDSNIYLCYTLMLISVVMGYAYSARTSLINAYKNNYVTTTIYSIGFIVELIIQIFVVYKFHSLELYFLSKIINTIIQWILTSIHSRNNYSQIISMKESLEEEDKKEIQKNTKALFMHKLGMVLVNSIDSIIISAFISVEILGKYSNYTTIVVAMSGIISLFFSPLTAVIGHLCAKDDINETRKYYDLFFNFNYMIGVIFFLGYYAVIKDLIPICFGRNEDLIMDKSIPIIITINYFVQFMRQSVLLFRDASGAFYNDRWKPLLEGIANLVLSILFVKIFPSGYEVLGVIVATILTNLFICHIVEPFVLYKYILKTSPKKEYLRRYAFIAIFVLLIFLLDFVMISKENYWLELFINGCISMGLGILLFTIMYLFSRDFRKMINKFVENIKLRFIRIKK